jgi:HEAT repeat protein
MSTEFRLALDRVLNRSQAPEDLIAEDRRVLLQSRVDSVATMLRVASAKAANPRTLAVIGWLLPRWPGGARSTAFLDATAALLSHPSPAVRGEAAVSLGLFRLKRAASALLRALNDSDDEVRLRAIASLALHGHPRTLPVLAQLLANHGESASIRAAAADAMGGFDAKQSEAALAAALSDPSPIVRASAVHSFGELRVSSATGRLRRLAGRDRSVVVRDAARAALARIRA